jgi:glycosyltransferase involved in cell wall biosynthesis
MKVLYISKALVVAAYRDKLRALGEYATVTAVIPERWGRARIEDGDAATPVVRYWPVRLDGHNHLHVYRSVGALLRQARPDLVHIDEEPYSLVAAQLGRACHRLGIPFVFYAWQNLDKRLPPPFGAVRRYVLRRAAAGLAGSDDAAGILRRAGFTGPLAVVPQFGVDVRRFAPDRRAAARLRARFGVPAGALLVGFGGRLVREKGVHLLLEAARGLPDVHVLFIGGGPERPALQRDAVLWEMWDRVHFTGALHSLAVPAHLAALDILVLPSLRAAGWVEQFGRILVEAMACGVPVIGAASGEIPRVIGDAGLVVPGGDAAALRAAIGGLGVDGIRRDELGRRGRARVLDRYTNERIAADTARLYATVLGGATAAVAA